MYTTSVLPGGKILRLSTVHFWCTVSDAWWGTRTDAQRTAYANGLTAKNAQPIAENTVNYGGRYWQWGMWQ